MNYFCTKKGIRREFSNARTPQQNGVAKRRNRTLIEAAKTMSADAKLPVICWAKAVNTACYVQNRVLTSWESLMLKEMKVILLENKLIEKGAGPNWLFNNDTLTNSMNYVLVVVAGTSSTNISGTKDVANQAVKKDVSSLRYIALPNWFYKAHMETSNDTIRNSVAHDDSQKEQDCNVYVPESSGISNPTATSKVPSADQVEPAISLTVEYEILTEEPKKIFDALKDPSWVEAMQEELLQFKIQNVWVLVDCLKGIRPIGTKWVLKNKKDERGIVIRNKARLVAQGFQDPEFLERVYKVEKAMYGLHQAPRAWYGTLSKPDIMFVVCACARHQVTPKECHPHAVKRIFRYLKGHPKLGLWYPKESPFELVAYLDSDYGGATQDRKSTTGEYVAAASGCGQVLWIQNKMREYGIETTDQETKIIATIDGKPRTIS
nr:hypothetical protein [Tanacetum cinerariifolium]